MPMSPFSGDILNGVEPEINLKNNNNSALFSSVCQWCFKNWKAVLVELLSTCLLIIYGCMSCIPAIEFSPQTPLYSALGFGLSITFLVQIFGQISGSHMNPSVTVASVIWGGTSICLGLFYVAAQCAGSLLGYYILIHLSPINLINDEICVMKPREDMSVLKVFGVEFVLTTAIIYMYCSVWDPVIASRRECTSIKLGLTFTGLALAGESLTGASMNPARSLGPAFWTGIWTMHWVYWVAPLVGSIAAVLSYKWCWMIDKRIKSKKESVDSDKPIELSVEHFYV